jgi:peptidoglycan/LPS O-acetylase OafA/YrhL
LKIRTFEAFRGLLALWVVIGHTILHSGYELARLGVFKPLSTPGIAVDCFIMLSGFVIFYLLDNQSVGYREFITRRFFRLAPLYLVVLIVSAWSIDWQLSVLQHYRWQNGTTAGDIVLHQNAIREMPAQFAAHLTMLHGLIPDSILPSSQYAIVGQAWSISVEWQFYLIAPFLFALVLRGKWRTLSCVLLLLCAVRAFNYSGAGFAVNQAGYFLVGILSYYLWKRVCSTAVARPDLIGTGSVIAMVLAYLLVPNSLSLVIWAAMMGVAFSESAQRRQGMFAKAGQILCSGPLQFLGRISYSMYMTHMVALYAWSAVLPDVLPNMDEPQFLVLNVVAVVVTVIPLSALSYRLVEAPGIRLGSRLAGRLSMEYKKTPKAVGI